MNDSPLTQNETSPVSVSRRVWPAILGAGLVLILAAAVGWWFLAGPGKAPDWNRVTEITFAAPAGDAFLAETPWVRLSLAPAQPGAENTIQLSLEAPRGTPVPGDASARITAFTAQPLSGDPAAAQALPLAPNGDGGFTTTALLDRAGWWRLVATVEDGGEPATVEFHLILPDPNINGPGAVGSSATSSDGETLFGRGVAAIAALQSVRYTQWMADGLGNAAISEHAVRTGGGDIPPAFTYRAAGGMDAVVIASTRWIRPPGVAEWQAQEGAIVVPPAEWLEEYSGATGFTVLGEETIDGERCQLLAFVVPEVSEPRRQTMAWYLWWVGSESGHVRKEAMVSRQHYMLNHFFAFDEPLEIVPPVGNATPAAGTPVS